MQYDIFNNWKRNGWNANTPEDFKKWQGEFKEWWNEQEFRNEEERQKFLQQIKDLTSKKEAYFSKQGQRPIVNRYIFQDELAAALTQWIKLQTEVLRKRSLEA